MDLNEQINIYSEKFTNESFGLTDSLKRTDLNRFK